MYNRHILTTKRENKMDDTYTRSDYMSNSEYMSEALNQYAGVYGEERQDEEWISSPYDTWHRNPYYTGVPGRHPEEDYEDE